jgi:ketosteroid isomerase-like protein
MSEANKQVVLRFIEAMGGNDPEGAATCLAPGAISVTKGYGNFSGARSAEVVLGAIESFKSLMPTGLRFTVGSVTAEGDRVVVEAVGNAVTGEGKAYCNDYCFVATLNDGRIAQFNEYLCTRLADEVLWPLAEKAAGGLKADVAQ